MYEYLKEVTAPLGISNLSKGVEHLRGLYWNLQPKQRALSLNKLREIMGLSKIWGGSIWDTMHPPGW